ncbi:hypothetical protein ETB97_003205 [Aspergillus alliaceus]|uniref:C2H2-type domain-containing protein n=1 Tax=Petromyces alliaceus TaxID=209559 RepID=A0A8H6A0E8_PETAA|nr:hypothetical protein ETB97_003205 [Aspergillus burnettii]
MRHSRRHSQDRPHKCPFCSKSFPRKDTLKRHVGIHGKEASSIYATSATAELTRAAHACRRKGQSCIYDDRRDRPVAPSCEDTRFHQGAVPENGDVRNEAVWLSDMSASSCPGDAGDTPSSLKGNGRRENMNRDGMVAAADDLCGTYNQEPVYHSSWPQQDPTFGFSFDPSIFWCSEETDRIFGHPLPDPTNGVTANVADSENLVRLTMPGVGDLGESSPKPSRTTASVSLCSMQKTGAELFHSATAGVISSLGMCSDAGGRLRTGATQIATREQIREKGISVIGFSELPSHDREILASEQYYHVPRISDGAYNNMIAFCIQQCDVTEGQTFPDVDILNTFMQMYFEFCHEELPLFHLPTFDPSPESWIVVAAIIAVGSNYSMSRYRLEVSDTLLSVLHRAVAQKMTDNTLVDGDLELAQGILLFNLCQMFHGTRGEFLKLQCQRNILITICRRHMAQASSIFSAETAPDVQGCEDAWRTWIAEESWRRLAYATWILECFQWIMFDTQPILACWELRLSLPCHESIWKCTTRRQWEQLASTESLAQPSIATIMKARGALTVPTHSLGGFASLVVMLTFSAEDKRQRNFATHGAYRESISIPGRNAQSELLGTDRRFQLQASGIASLRQKMCLALSILQEVDLCLLYRASGWLTSSKDRDAARGKLSVLFSNSRSTARRTLRHAASLFRLIKTQRKMSYCDPQMFLIATLYIWFYAEMSGNFRDPLNSSGLAKWDRPLRIDQELDGDEEALEEWVVNGDERPVYITSVGILQNSDGCVRLLNESIRVLRHENAWAGIGRGIAQAIERILVSGTTSFDGQSPYPNNATQGKAP